MKLACADDTFRLLRPHRAALELVAALGVEGVDLFLAGNRSSVRPEDVRGDLAGATLEGVAGAFLTTTAQVAAIELAGRGITANVVVPALEPDEQTVQAVVDLLLSDAASGVTGAVIAADGGFSITKSSEPSPLLGSA